MMFCFAQFLNSLKMNTYAESLENGSIHPLLCTWYFHNMLVRFFSFSYFSLALAGEVFYLSVSSTLIYLVPLSIEKWLKV